MLDSCNGVNLYTDLKNKHFYHYQPHISLPSISSSPKSPTPHHSNHNSFLLNAPKFHSHPLHYPSSPLLLRKLNKITSNHKKSIDTLQTQCYTTDKSAKSFAKSLLLSPDLAFDKTYSSVCTNYIQLI